MKISSKQFFLFFTLTAALFAFSCKSLSLSQEYFIPPESEKAENIQWEEISQGLSKHYYKDSQVEYHIAKIDLNLPWEIKSFPEKSGWNKAQNVKDFSKKNKLQVAINTNPFEAKNSLILTGKVKNLGIIISHGKIISEANPKYSALLFYRQNDGTFTAEIAEKQDEVINKKPDFAFGGFFTILDDSKIYQYKNYKYYRSAAAVSKDGKKLYLLAGKGLSYMDTAKIFLKLGAYKALQFDGGKSTVLIIKNKEYFHSPLQRKVASAFGLFLSTENKPIKIDEYQNNE
ncbi:MAG: phosphodiester glycosidase family protein [Treponema sp.]|nr:phosphodiester glycosidase family protein [Treponema sp.]